MSFFGKIKDFFVAVKVKVSSFFVKVFGQEAAQRFADGAVLLLKTAAGKLAVDAVMFVQTLALDGAGKRQAAFDKIVSDARAQGLEISSSLVNMLIELAVQHIAKQNFYPQE